MRGQQARSFPEILSVNKVEGGSGRVRSQLGGMAGIVSGKRR